LHRNSGGGEYVEQVKNGKTVQTTVQVGIASGGQTQITSGLAPGDQILAPVPQATGGDRTGRTGGGTGGGQFPGGGTGGGQFPGGGFGGGGGFPGGGRFSGAGGGGG
jgi:hypothetical protein